MKELDDMNYYMQLADNLYYPKKLIGTAIPFFMYKGLYTLLTTKDQNWLFTWNNEGHSMHYTCTVKLYKTRLKQMQQMMNRTGKQYPDWKMYVEPFNLALAELDERKDNPTFRGYNYIIGCIGTMERLKERFNYD